MIYWWWGVWGQEAEEKVDIHFSLDIPKPLIKKLRKDQRLIEEEKHVSCTALHTLHEISALSLSLSLSNLTVATLLLVISLSLSLSFFL